ncbi:flagellar biosynthetic protein FliO [Herbaspirillum sp. NPDC087042]|uniref:flagellar biosynthetic protein FliO n=1 Tax=Herbaspirillum sp. NPDC087042 TaxID=3364004 RepID=UPI00381EF11F
MKRIRAASLSRSLQQTRAGLVSARLFLGGSLLACAQAWAENAAPASTTTASIATPPAAVAGSAIPSSSGSVFTMLFGLAAVLALMAAVAWLLKRFGLTQGLAGNAVAKVVGGVSVGTRERVMVVEVGEQWIVVGVAPGRVNALATLPRQEVAPQQDSKTGTPAFAAWLKQTMDKRNGEADRGARPGQDGSTS